MEEEEETDLARVDSWLQSTVPSIPKFFAVICLIFNIVVPGLGTFLGGFLSCCCGRPRLEFRPAQYRCPVAFLVMLIGVAQLLATAFFLVGWLWSIIWGFLMVNLSGEEFRKMPPKPEPEPPPQPVVAQPKTAAASTTIQIEGDISAGRKNFSNLINKAKDNKELAMRDGDFFEVRARAAAEASGDAKDEKSATHSADNHVSHGDKDISAETKSVEETPESTEIKISDLTPTPASSITFGPTIMDSDESSPPAPSTILSNKDGGLHADFTEQPLASSSHRQQSPALFNKKRSIFSCFKPNPKSFVTEKLGQFISGHLSSSLMDLLEENNGTPNSQLRIVVHQMFHKWRKRANEMASSRLKLGNHSLLSRLKLSSNKEPSPAVPVLKEISNIVVNSASSNHSSSNSLHHEETPTMVQHPDPQVVPVDIEQVATLTPVSSEEPEGLDQLPLNPSKLLEALPTEKPMRSSKPQPSSRTAKGIETAKRLKPKQRQGVAKNLHGKQHSNPGGVTEMKPRITKSHTYHYSVQQ